VVLFLVILVAFLADLIPDLRAFGRKALKRHLVLAKLMALCFSFCATLISSYVLLFIELTLSQIVFVFGCVWVLVNTYIGQSDLWLAPLRGVVQSLYAIFYGIHITLMIATWYARFPFNTPLSSHLLTRS